MRRRRAQYFAPAIKKIGTHKDIITKEYEDYVLKKRKVYLDPEMFVEKNLKKSQIYRSPSCEAIMRMSEYLGRDQLVLG